MDQARLGGEVAGDALRRRRGMALELAQQQDTGTACDLARDALQPSSKLTLKPQRLHFLTTSM